MIFQQTQGAIIRTFLSGMTHLRVSYLLLSPVKLVKENGLTSYVQFFLVFFYFLWYPAKGIGTQDRAQIHNEK